MAQAQAQPEIDLDAQKPAGSKKKTLFLYLGIVILAIGIGVGVTLYFVKGNDHEKSGKGGKPQEAAKVEVKPAIYVPLRTLVVNISTPGPVRYLQVDAQVMTLDPAVAAGIETHMPAIRNDLLFLLGNQTYENVNTPQGKEQLREEMKKIVQRILEQQQIQGNVEAVYFTSFVMQ